MENLNSIPALGASSSRQPDLSWSQVRETVLMLAVGVGQIEHALTDGNESVDALAGSFAEMYKEIRSIRELMMANEDFLETDLGKEIYAKTSDIASKTDNAIVAFQFYDRLTQRLHHVSESVMGLSHLVSDFSKIYNPNEWVALQEKIRNRYSMEEERVMFDLILQGVPLEDALAQTEAAVRKKLEESGGDDLILF